VRLNTNDRVLIRGIKGDWFQVIAETGNSAYKGWVHGHYVRKAQPVNHELAADIPVPVTPPSVEPALQPPSPVPVLAVQATPPAPVTADPTPAAPPAAPGPAPVAPAKMAPSAHLAQPPHSPAAEPSPAPPVAEKDVEPPKTDAPALAATSDPAMAPAQAAEQEKSFEFAKDIPTAEPVLEQAGAWDIARLGLRFAALILATTAFAFSRRHSGPLVTARC